MDYSRTLNIMKYIETHSFFLWIHREKDREIDIHSDSDAVTFSGLMINESES